MVSIAAAIALEKLVARGPLIAQAIGVAAIAAGVVMLARLAFVSIV
jgi:hypothetical protein